MVIDLSKLSLVGVGSSISYESLVSISQIVRNSFLGFVDRVEIQEPMLHAQGLDLESIDVSLERIDVRLMASILRERYDQNTLGVIDADLRTDQTDQFYGYLFGAYDPERNVAMVSTSRLAPLNFEQEADTQKFVSRIAKVGLHEVGHGLGFRDHYSYQTAQDGTLCPMTRGEYNKFGQIGYIRSIVDQRGFQFCDECTLYTNLGNR